MTIEFRVVVSAPCHFVENTTSCASSVARDVLLLLLLLLAHRCTQDLSSCALLARINQSIVCVFSVAATNWSIWEHQTNSKSPTENDFPADNRQGPAFGWSCRLACGASGHLNTSLLMWSQLARVIHLLSRIECVESNETISSFFCHHTDTYTADHSSIHRTCTVSLLSSRNCVAFNILVFVLARFVFNTYQELIHLSVSLSHEKWVLFIPFILCMVSCRAKGT